MREWIRGKTPYIVSVCFFAAGIAGVILAMVLGKGYSVPGNRETETISFAICGDAQRQKVAEEAAEAFMRQNDCRVEIHCYPSESDLNRNILGQIAGGSGFDVFSVSRSLLLTLKEKEQLAALDDINEERRQDGNEFYGAALKEGKIGDVQYAMPVGVMPYMLYYNQDFLERIGMEDPQEILEDKRWDLSGFAEYAREIHEKTQDAGVALFSEAFAAEPFLRSGGGSWEYRGNRPAADGKMAETAELLEDLVQEGAIGCYGPDEYAMVKERFAAGEVPVMLGDLTMTRACSQSEFAWDIVPIPSPGSDFSNTTFEVPLIAVGNGRHVRLAKRFVSYYVSALGQKIRLEKGECLMPSLDMVFYTSMDKVVFPEHSNYYFFAINNGYAVGRAGLADEEKEWILELWKSCMGKT